MSMWIRALIIVAMLATLVAPLLWMVRRDGLGHRPPPPSRHDWFGEPS